MKRISSFIWMICCLAVLICMQMTAVSAAMQQVDYSVSNITGFSRPSQANSVSNKAYLEMNTLKYEPYPVNAGDWFDLWLKVENTGNEDAEKVTFELLDEYPFSLSESPIKEFGIVPGTLTAFENKQAGDVISQANQVIMKYRVKVADNAPEGETILKIKARTDSDAGNGFMFSLPITVGKTKTDFDIVMQDSTTQGMSFAVANTGQKAATAVIISIEPQQGLNMTGATSSVIGNLAAGDFTTVSFQVTPSMRMMNRTAGTGSRASYGNNANNNMNNNAGSAPNMNSTQPPSSINQLTMKVSYTDTAGIRNTVEKVVPVNFGQKMGQFGAGTRSQSTGLTNYVYLGIGLVAGVLITLAYRRFRKKKQ